MNQGLFSFFFILFVLLQDMVYAGFVTSKHKGDYSRLSFNWESQVEYEMKQEGKLVTIRFKKSYPITKAQIETQLKNQDMSVHSYTTGKDFLEISFELKRPGHALTLNKGSMVALDFIYDKTPVDNKKSEEKPKVEIEAERKQHLPEIDESKAQGSEEKTTKNSPEKTEAIPIQIVERVEGLRLIFDFPEDTMAGAFIEAGELWVFFNKATQFSWDTQAMKDSQILQDITTFKSQSLSVLKIDLSSEPDKAVLYKKGNQWILENTDMHGVIPNYVGPVHAGNALLLENENFAAPVFAQMPRTGNPRYFVPVKDGAVRLDRKRQYVDCILPASLLGIVVDPLSQGLKVEKQEKGVVISKVDGLQISPAADLQSNRIRYKMPSLYNFALWKEEDKVIPDTDFQWRINSQKKSLRTSKRLDLVKHYLLTKRYYEAKGLLKAALIYDPSLEKSPYFHSLCGISAFAAQQYDTARKSFEHSSVEGDTEMRLWEELSKCRDEPYEVKYPVLLEGVAYLQDYPSFLKVPALLLASEAAILQNKDAKPFLEVLDKNQLNTEQKEHLNYLLIFSQIQKEKNVEGIRLLTNYSQTMQSKFRLRSSLLLLKLRAEDKSITPKEESELLEKLRYKWSGDPNEYHLWTRLSSAYGAMKDYPKSLKFLRKAVRHFPRLSSIHNLQQQGERCFEQAVNDPESDLITLIGLFQEYDMFIPTDERRTKLQENLLDLLVQADLVDPAMQLMDENLKDNLINKEQKEKIKMRYGLLALLNDEPDKTLSVVGYKPQDNYEGEGGNQKRFLIAQALMMKGAYEDMRSILDGVKSPAAYELVTQSYMNQKDWSHLAGYIQSHLKEQKKNKGIIEPEAVLRLATAFSLMNQDHELKKLKIEYGALMDKSTSKEAFDLLTSEDTTDFSSSGLSRELDKSTQMTKTLESFGEKVKKQGLSSF